MGLVGNILSFVGIEVEDIKISEVKLDPDGGSIITATHFSTPGEDSTPLTTDSVVVVDIQGSGKKAAVGYVDPKNSKKSTAGEKRIYGRDPDTGSEVNEVWLKEDGSVIISNSNGSFELKIDGSIKGINGSGSFELEAAGDFVVNGAKITAAGDVVSATGKSLSTHTHPINSGSSAPGPTGAPS